MGDITHITGKKIFTLSEARDLLPLVRRITAEAVARAEILAARYDALPEDHEARPRVEDELNQVVGRWGEKINRLGAEAKGLWLVDFDNGEGYYCWRYPEDSIGYFHGYEDGFKGRVPIN